MTKKSRTREARQRRQKQQRQNQQRIILVGVVIVAVLVISLIVVLNQPAEAFIPLDVEARYEGLSYSLSLEGYPRIGDSDAPVTIEEYASFSCLDCEVFHSASFDAILDRVRTGQVLFTYIPLQTGAIPNAQGAARTALCAGQQGMFWEMHDVLFEWQSLYDKTAFSQNRLLSGVDALGLNNGSFTSCFNSSVISNVLEAAQNEGVVSTPTIDVNGVTVKATEGDGMPTTEEILTAIDSATPNDWTPNAVDSDESEADTPEATAEVEQTPEVTVEVEQTPEVTVEVEQTPEVTAEAEQTPEVENEATEEADVQDAKAEETPEATAEADE